MRAQNICQVAGHIRREMQHHDIGGPGIRRDVIKEALQCLYAARRGADADNGQFILRRHRTFPSNVVVGIHNRTITARRAIEHWNPPACMVFLRRQLKEYPWVSSSFTTKKTASSPKTKRACASKPSRRRTLGPSTPLSACGPNFSRNGVTPG